jgi:hypothetical protein
VLIRISSLATQPRRGRPGIYAPANKYLFLEQLFLTLSRAYFGPTMTLAQIDLLIWTQMSGRLDVDIAEPELPGQPV